MILCGMIGYFWLQNARLAATFIIARRRRSR